MLKISLAGANNSVPTTGLTPCIIASEASFLVCSKARIFSLYIYISGRTSCRKCSKCFYVYLNIRPVRYSARIFKYCSATGLLPNRERPGVNGLPFSHRRKETPVFNNFELLVNRRLRQNRRKRDKPVFNN